MIAAAPRIQSQEAAREHDQNEYGQKQLCHGFAPVGCDGAAVAKRTSHWDKHGQYDEHDQRREGRESIMSPHETSPGEVRGKVGPQGALGASGAL